MATGRMMRPEQPNPQIAGPSGLEAPPKLCQRRPSKFGPLSLVVNASGVAGASSVLKPRAARARFSPRSCTPSMLASRFSRRRWPSSSTPPPPPSRCPLRALPGNVIVRMRRRYRRQHPRTPTARLSPTFLQLRKPPGTPPPHRPPPQTPPPLPFLVHGTAVPCTVRHCTARNRSTTLRTAQHRTAQRHSARLRFPPALSLVPSNSDPLRHGHRLPRIRPDDLPTGIRPASDTVSDQHPTQPPVVLARWLGSTHRPPAPDWSVVLFWHPSACGALQECLGAEVASPARVEKDPQGRLYLAAEVCQLRAPSGLAVPSVPPGPHAPSSTPRTPTFCRPSSAALCVARLSGERCTCNLRFR